MSAPDSDKLFTGSIPQIYEKYLVPLIFEPYAEDLATRLSARSLGDVLEIAAGTGVVTRRLASRLPSEASIVASDLNQAMLDHAAAIGTARPVEWRQADALALPFADASFDAIACQFGVMFFPDKPKAFAEAYRVLRPGGVLVFNVWDRLEENEFADCITTALGVVFPDDPPRFLARTPYAYNDPATIRRDLAAGGFTADAQFETVSSRSPAASPRDPVVGYCEGSPLKAEIEARGKLGDATDAATKAIEKRFGSGAIDAKIQALVVTITK